MPMHFIIVCIPFKVIKKIHIHTYHCMHTKVMLIHIIANMDLEVVNFIRTLDKNTTNHT